MVEQQEKRKWPRQDMALKIRLRPVSAGESGEGDLLFYTKNISTGGLFFEGDTPQGVTPGALFDIEINMPPARFGFTSSRRLEARGKVCRVEKGGRDEVGVAVEFIAPPRFAAP